MRFLGRTRPPTTNILEHMAPNVGFELIHLPSFPSSGHLCVWFEQVQLISHLSMGFRLNGCRFIVIQPGAAAAVITVPSIGSRRSQHHLRSLPALVRAKVDTRASNMTEALASKTCAPCRGGIPPLTREQAELFHAQAPDWQLAEEAQHRAELPVSQIPRGAYLPSKYPRISSRLRSLEAYTQTITLRLLGITGDRECCAPAYSREASCPSLNACRPSFHSLHLSAPLVRSARPR